MPTVTFKQAGSGLLSKKGRFSAVRSAERGRYIATITAEEPGMVEIHIDADWYSSDVTLVPIPVVAPGEKPAPLATQDRGRLLFVAAGCVTCHVKTDDPLWVTGRLFR